ncbi:hypothetical protein EJB05_38060, partial [Eragrostis curvula]
MTRLFGSFMNDLACRAMMGKDFQNKGLDMQFLELIADTSPLISKFNMEEYFPFLARFGVLSKTVHGKSPRVKRRWDKLLDGLIQEHEVSASDPKDRDNFVPVLLSVREEYGRVLWGIETSASTLDFTIAELMRRPDLMSKLQVDVRRKVPEGQ